MNNNNMIRTEGSNEIKVYTHEKFGNLRMVEMNGEPWFVGRDVAEALGYKKPLNAIDTHVEKDDSLKQGLTDSLGRKQKSIFINESGMYALIFGSQLERAREFKHWVTSKVLPSIRKHGGYIVGQDNENISEEELLSRALLVAKSRLEEKEKEIQVLKPDAIVGKAVSSTRGSISVGELAKILRKNGVSIGRNRLYKELRENKYVMTQKGEYNMPTQKSTELGVLEIAQKPTTRGCVNKRTMVTMKGEKYFTNKYLSK